MATITRRDKAPVIDRLLLEERRFGLFQAISLIEQLYGMDVSEARAPEDAAIRFRASMDFGFHGSPIESLSPDRIALEDPFQVQLSDKQDPRFIKGEMRRFARRLMNITLKPPTTSDETSPPDVARLQEDLETKLKDHFRIDEQDVITWFEAQLPWLFNTPSTRAEQDALDEITTTTLSDTFFDFLTDDDNHPAASFEQPIDDLIETWPKSPTAFWSGILSEDDQSVLATEDPKVAPSVDESYIRARFEDLNYEFESIPSPNEEIWTGFRHWFETATTRVGQTPRDRFDELLLEKLRCGLDVSLDQGLDLLTELAVVDCEQGRLPLEIALELIEALAAWPTRTDTPEHELLSFRPPDDGVSRPYIRTQIRRHLDGLLSSKVIRTIGDFIPNVGSATRLYAIIMQAIPLGLNISDATLVFLTKAISENSRDPSSQLGRRFNETRDDIEQVAIDILGVTRFKNIKENINAQKEGLIQSFLDAVLAIEFPVVIELERYLFLSSTNVAGFLFWQLGEVLEPNEAFPITADWMCHRLLALLFGADDDEGTLSASLSEVIENWPRRTLFGHGSDEALAIGPEHQGQSATEADPGFIIDQLNLLFERLADLSTEAGEPITEVFGVSLEEGRQLMIANVLSRLGQTVQAPLLTNHLKAHTLGALRFSPQLQKAVRSVAEMWPKQPNRAMVVNTISLGGSQGPLPWGISEILQLQIADGATGMRDFLDIFNHRLVALAYKIKKAHRFELERNQPAENSFSQKLFALLGLGLPELRDRMSLPDSGLLKYAGLFALKRRSLGVLKRILEDSFDVSIECRPFEGCWIDRSLEDTTVLGGPQRLGIDTPLGTRAFVQDARFKILIGPVGSDRYIDFLPIGKAFEAVVETTRCYISSDQDFLLELLLDPNDLPRETLCASSEEGPRLGWNSLLHAEERLTAKPSRGLRLGHDTHIHAGSHSAPLPPPAVELHVDYLTSYKGGLFSAAFFEALTIEEFRAIRSFMRPEKHQPGQVLLETRSDGLDEQEVSGAEVVIVTSGIVEVLQRKSSTSRLRKTKQLGVGAVFGLEVFLGHKPIDQQVRAIETTWVLRISPADQKEIFERRPRIKRLLLDAASGILGLPVRVER